MSKIINLEKALEIELNTDKGDIKLKHTLEHTFPNEDQLTKFGKSQYENFINKKPFPHIILSDFVPKQLLDNVLEELEMGIPKTWYKSTHKNSYKLFNNDFEEYSNLQKLLFLYLISDKFMSFLKELTGIKDLVPDTSLFGGGISEIYAGGYLNPHADFNKHQTELKHLGEHQYRRLNLLLYLNRDWKEECGCSLDLFDENKQLYVQYPPLFNNCVIFETSKKSYHGNSPWKCNGTRRAISVYYYSKERGGQDEERHDTLYF